jgi:hypothetical protein
VVAALALLGLRFEAASRPPYTSGPKPTLKTPPPSPSGGGSEVAPRSGPDELARLREENQALREKLRAEADARLAAKEELADALHELGELRRPLEVDMASSTLRASLTPGEGVVTGGYRLPDGSRLFAFVETDTRADGGIGVMSRFYSVPDASVPGLGLQNLLTEAANTLQHGEVWVRDEIADVTRRMQQPGTARPVGLGATSLRPGEASVLPIESDPPITFRIYAESGGDKGLELELRLESVPATSPQ